MIISSRITIDQCLSPPHSFYAQRLDKSSPSLVLSSTHTTANHITFHHWIEFVSSSSIGLRPHQPSISSSVSISIYLHATTDHQAVFLFLLLFLPCFGSPHFFQSSLFIVSGLCMFHIMGYGCIIMFYPRLELN